MTFRLMYTDYILRVFVHTMKVSGFQSFLLASRCLERKSYRFGMTLGSVNDDRMMGYDGLFNLLGKRFI